ncbi:NACHT domain-containing protein [Actinoplanes sp. CA-030573]|uniref:NACHT domain-containing protein n=1 Tax=Actinoplanes sp. CA-030573 TaxID=3239898 RepID=UPI003D8B53CB
MAKTISYADAILILGGGPQSAIFRRVDAMTGGLLAGAAIAAPPLLGLLDLRAELARVSGELVNAASRAMTGSARRDRTERLAAAHAVIVIAAYFDALSDVDLSWARTTRHDQPRLAGQGADGARDLATSALRAGVLLPEPHVPQEKFLAELEVFYDHLSDALARFLAGLAPYDELSDGERAILRRDIRAGGRRAIKRYEEMLLNLMADCPDLALWIDHRHQLGVERRPGSLEPSLRELERLLRSVTTETTAEGVADALQRAHGALLERGVIEPIDLPGGLVVPALERAYIPPAFQVATRVANRSPAGETFWQDVEVRPDLDRFLAGYLGSPRALRAPLLVLGSPGAGKSLLTKILAARLASTRFLPIRVPLRDADGGLPLPRQVEQAVRAATGEETTWADLTRSTDAVPVIIFDGFDELLPATGAGRRDFLQTAADFQEREHEQGRAVAVIVTSRTSAAERASLPAETVLLRLRPFDEPRIRRWVDVWNKANDAGLAADDVLAHPGLAGQPLLLLLLALYDADGHALRRGPAGPLTTGELFERLLTGFARREVATAYPDADVAQRESLAEQELDRLAVVAFAMLNRSAQWVGEEAVGQDLRATLGDPAPGPLPGRFFFVRRARDAYEFLHSMVGEYLVARLTWRLLGETVARDAVTPAGRPMTGNDLMADLLSVVPLTARTPIVEFLAGMAVRLGAEDRARWTGVLVRLFRQCERDGAWPSRSYRPAARNVAARFAAYTANLVLLAVAVAGELRFGDLAEAAGGDPSRRWHDHAMLWHGQFDGDAWDSFVETFAIERVADGAARDVRLVLDDGSYLPSRPDPYGLLVRPSSAFDHDGQVEAHRRRVPFYGCLDVELAWHTIEPLLASGLAATAGAYVSWWPDRTPSAAQALLEVWLLPATKTTPAEAVESYLRCLRIVLEFPGWDDDLRDRYADQLFAALTADRDAPTEAALMVMRCLLGSVDAWMRAAAEILDRLDPAGPEAAMLAEIVFSRLGSEWSRVTDHRAAVLAGARAAATRRRRRVPDVLSKLDRGRESAGIDEMRGELETFRVRLASIRTGADRWRTDLAALFDEFSWLAGSADHLHASLVALARTPDAVADIDAALSYVEERIAAWLADNR